MSHVERRFHEAWLGMVQPVQGLVVSVPALVEAQCARPATREEHLALREALTESDEGREAVGDFAAILDLLGFQPDDFDTGDALPDELSLWVPEGRQLFGPTRALRKVRDDSTVPAAASTPAEDAGRNYELLVWELPAGLDLDRPETTTGEWHYPPTAKFDRLLRHTRVPIGVLFNGEVLRLVVAPHGETSGAITFRLSDIASVGGKDMLGGLLSLLSAQTVFTTPERNLRHILVESRRRQADVTNDLANQVFEAIELLLRGFEAAAERGDGSALRRALEVDDDHAYRGLLSVLLRLVFLLYAEDRGLMPVDEPLYADNLGVLGLWESLQSDAGTNPDTMHQRFGAWPRLLALFRAVHDGMHFGDVQTPPRRGVLFDPDAYPFLEGRGVGDPTPRLVEERAQVQTPLIDDGTVHEVLRKLLLLGGQRLSYQALDVEQIGSVYERLMGYHVMRLGEDAVCLREAGVWVTSDALAETAKAQRARWLKDETGLSNARAKKVAAAWSAAEDAEGRLAALELEQKSRTTRLPSGTLVLQPGSERRRTSSHYTPRSLSSRIVRRALEPLLNTMGEDRTSEAILALKVCDPAMGSGAFLVEACRLLADEVVAAWTRERRVERIGDEHGDPVLYARRLVAQRCLYGVDKNRYAVDLAKLSLWLVTLASDQPFTFVDHALRHGDALVGLDVEQIRSLSWKVSLQQVLVQRELNTSIENAVRLRRDILELAESTDPEDAKRKAWLLRDADDALERARLIADVIIGAFFSVEKKSERKAALAERQNAITSWLASGQTAPAHLRRWQDDAKDELPPFHWMLEFPEVFAGERPDPLDHGRVNAAAWFDAFIGNPPFLGGRRIRDSLGHSYTQFVEMSFGGSKNADLSARFFQRAMSYLGEHGSIGFVATNTIAQGDTRVSGLKRLLHRGAVVYDAVTSMAWPGEAGVTISTVHIAVGSPSRATRSIHLDGQPVLAINSRLRPSKERPDPVPLRANNNLSFNGMLVLGMGFTLTPAERDELVSHSPGNALRISPFIGGREVNSSPTQQFERYVIDFAQLDLAETEAWPELLKLVRTRVKPERDRVRRDAHKKYWWRFGDSRPALRRALENKQRCLVTAIVTKHCIFSFQPTDRVFSHKLCVFPLDSFADFAVLQSQVHIAWAWLLSSTMKSDLNYSASKCFDTFPFPPASKLRSGTSLQQVAEALYQGRADYMVENSVGLTTTYNRLRNSQCEDITILKLRELHREMERGVLAAYGWSEIEVPPYEDPTTDAQRAAKQAFEDEVIDRLFALNAERAKEEAMQGAGTPKDGERKKQNNKASGQGELL